MKLIGKYTLGTNVTFTWTVLTNGEAVSLEGRDLSVICTDVFHRTIPCTYTIIEADITVSVSASDQRAYGLLFFTLIDGERVLGVRGIELVPEGRAGEDGATSDVYVTDGLSDDELQMLRGLSATVELLQEEFESFNNNGHYYRL